MQTIQIEDSFISTLLKTKLEIQEYNLIKAYDRGELSIGQVAIILNLTKVEVMELLEKYDIPFIRVDSEYLEQEFSAFLAPKLYLGVYIIYIKCKYQ